VRLFRVRAGLQPALESLLEPEAATEPQDALDPQIDESGPGDDLGDAGKSTGGPGFITPIGGL